MKTTLQLISKLQTKRNDWLAQANSKTCLSGAQSYSRGIADGILIAIGDIREACAIPDATPVVPPLMKLALALNAKASDINCGRDHTQESPEVRRILVVIYAELAAKIQSALQ